MILMSCCNKYTYYVFFFFIAVYIVCRFGMSSKCSVPAFVDFCLQVGGAVVSGVFIGHTGSLCAVWKYACAWLPW